MTARLAGKRAIVTGGGSGIGAASVRRFVNEGARVVIGEIDIAAGEALARELGDEHAIAIEVDVADQPQVEAFVAQAAVWLGGIDILFNNAGIGMPGTTTDLDPALWRRVFAVDVDAVFFACRAALPVMIAGGGGAIVNTASISGLRGDYALIAYNAAKGAVINYTRAMAVDHAFDRVRVNAICPGLIETPLTASAKAAGLWPEWTSTIPMRRAGTAEEMANIALFLASDEASYMTGSIVVADGGRDASTGQPDLKKLITTAEAA